LNDNIRLTVVDALHFPELAEKDSIQSVPTLILEDQFRWSGTFQIDEIVEVMANRDPSFLGPVSLEMMLKEGKAGQLADMMLAKVEIFPAFYALLIHSKWPVRLGAMVVMDELIEKNPDLAVQTQDYLLRSFKDVADTVKGDLLYMLGEMGRRQSIALLQSVLADKHNTEVKEAAREALDKVKSRISKK
jgi:HEAT repeat protein